MNDFWAFARRMLDYRRLLAFGFGAALLDALCAFGGFATLMWVIDQIFRQERTVRDVVAQRLDSDGVQRIFGDVSHLAEWVPAGQLPGLAMLLGIIFVLAILGSAMRYLHHLTSITVSMRTILRIRRDAFHRLLHAPIETILTIGTADNLSRVVRDTTQLARGFEALMGKAVRDVLVGTAFLMVGVLIDWQLSLIFLVGLPIIYVCIRKFGKRIRRAARSAFQAYGFMTGALQESMQALPVVKTHNAEGYERRRFGTINREVLRQEMRARKARAMSSPVIELLAITGVMIVTLIAAWMVFHDESRQPQDLLMVLLALGAAGGSFRPLANINNDLQESSAAARRIREVLDLPVEANTLRGEDRHAEPLPRHSREVHFDHVSYRYPNADRFAVHQVDLHVKHGQTIAVVGPNGSGKSTLLNLLPRLTNPSEGRVLIDGVDIANVNLRQLRSQIAVVTQQTYLFAGTIADNIAYGRRHITRDAIERAAKSAFAHEFVAALPDGYDTKLGESGSGLSGGQRQRLALARAILRDPAILILDEATSQIDTDSEAKISEALASFREGRTTFIVAHRLSTVVDADCIVVMEAGKIADMGTHHELLERSAIYQTLTRTQLMPSGKAGA
ncbi:ABC transporter ATP-binding protein [Phycisphaerales bacterium AB-hyl4]|uniref:ABC transporter ATP-binding protein n=1 Tax=Natronomicrosphaera hydrolytica TaxID=3242702 RepID=A0ABV4U1X7_9BACT